MTSRKRWFFVVMSAVLALSACSSPVGADTSSTVSEGAIELAVSETCAEGSAPECVVVNGDSIVLPAEFEKAGVESSSIVKGDGQNAVDVTFNDDGAKVFHKLTEQATGAGSTARLVIKIGEKIQGAPAVMEAIKGNTVQIMLPPGDSPQKILELIHGEG